MCNVVFFELSDNKVCGLREALLLSYLVTHHVNLCVDKLPKALGVTKAAAKKALEALWCKGYVDKSDGQYVLCTDAVAKVLSRVCPDWEQQCKDGHTELRQKIVTHCESLNENETNHEAANLSGEQGDVHQSAKKPVNTEAAPQSNPTFELIPQQENEKPVKHRQPRFKAPTLEEVENLMTDYIDQLTREGDTKAATIDPHYAAQSFFEYYSSNGWKVGRNPMKSWEMAAKRAIREWGNLHGSKYRNEYTEKEIKNMTPSERKEYEANKPDEPYFKPEDIVYKADGTLDFSASNLRKIIRETDEEEAEKRRRSAIEGTAEEVQDPFLISQN